MTEVPLFVVARWGAFSGFVPELPVVPTGLVGLQRDVGVSAVAIFGIRVLLGSSMRATVCGMPAVKELGARYPRLALVARSVCRASKGKSFLW